VQGTLYIVSTPIGNLSDISFRALEILEEVDLIAAEDSRITKRLLNNYKIKNSFIAYNNYNENKRYFDLIEKLKDGKNIALVSDAGTPCISDPGYKVVNTAKILGINVVTIPGASSVIAALSISGLPSDKFFFEGFLPKKKGRNKRFDFLASLDCTIIIFESPRRILKTLNDIFNNLGNRVIGLCKELTKLHENVKIGYVENIISEDLDSIKGEYIILVANKKYKIDE
tara:strand:+ start:2798 stop:3481 length:684 start_codon:yes stop_codon:yes gene_type:complete